MWLVWRAATTTAAHFVSVDVRPSLGPHPRPFSMLEKGGATLTRSCCSWSPDQLPLRPRRISLRALRGPAPLVQDTHCINNTPPTIYYPPSTFLPPPKTDRFPLTKRPTYSFTHLPAYSLTNLPSTIYFPTASLNQSTPLTERPTYSITHLPVYCWSRSPDRVVVGRLTNHVLEGIPGMPERQLLFRRPTTTSVARQY